MAWISMREERLMGKWMIRWMDKLLNVYTELILLHFFTSPKESQLMSQMNNLINSTLIKSKTNISDERIKYWLFFKNDIDLTFALFEAVEPLGFVVAATANPPGDGIPKLVRQIQSVPGLPGEVLLEDKDGIVLHVWKECEIKLFIIHGAKFIIKIINYTIITLSNT